MGVNVQKKGKSVDVAPDDIEDLARSAGLDVPREERTANDVARQ